MILWGNNTKRPPSALLEGDGWDPFEAFEEGLRLFARGLLWGVLALAVAVALTGGLR
jgi:hypothetical protein